MQEEAVHSFVHSFPSCTLAWHVYVMSPCSRGSQVCQWEPCLAVWLLSAPSESQGHCAHYRGDVQPGATPPPHIHGYSICKGWSEAPSLAPVYAEHAVRYAFTKPNLIYNVLLFKIFPTPFQLQDRVQTWTWHSLVTIQRSTGFSMLDDPNIQSFE